MKDTLQRIVDSGQLAGAATLVWKDGAAQPACFGWRDIERKLPVEAGHHLQNRLDDKADYLCRGAYVG
jgi:hypothetical protein